MSRHRLQFPAVFRVFAVAWLFVWLTAQTLCVHHCAALSFAKQIGGSECCAKKPSDSSKAPVGSGSISCGGLKTVKFEAKTGLSEVAAVIHPPILPVFVLTLPEVPADSAFTDYVRALPRADFVFRPEVSLGAALRSHAPPALA